MVAVLLLPVSMTAQQKYHIHEDVVKPSMTAEYETVISEVNQLVKEHPLEGVSMLVFQSSDNNYFWISPINSMADLDKPGPVAQLAEKAGKEKVAKLFERLNKCYDVEKDYIITLNEDLSYMPDGITQTPEGENYREHYKIYIAPGNRAVVKEKMEAVKELFKSKGSKMHYRVYESGFGTEAEYYMVSVAAKDELDMATKSKANEKILGEEREAIMFDLFQNILKIEETEGMMRPDLGTLSED